MYRRRSGWRRVLALVAPPHGREVRRFVAGIAVAIGISRVGLLDLVAPVGTGPVQVLQSLWYGWLFFGLSAALLATLRRRTRWSGRLCAVFGAALFGVLAYDVWPVVHSTLIYMICSYALLFEAGAMYD